MGQPAATSDSIVVGVDLHTVVVPSAPPALLPHPYAGRITSGMVSSVLVEGRPAATVGSTSQLDTPHLPTPPGTSFVTPPSGEGSVDRGSATVLIGGKAAARAGDPVTTCSEGPQPAAVVQASAGVLIG
jgi:uncharacterized Zn-binding protein involved in type VI secretion